MTWFISYMHIRRERQTERVRETTSYDIRDSDLLHNSSFSFAFSYNILCALIANKTTSTIFPNVLPDI